MVDILAHLAVQKRVIYGSTCKVKLTLNMCICIEAWFITRNTSTARMACVKTGQGLLAIVEKETAVVLVPFLSCEICRFNI